MANTQLETSKPAAPPAPLRATDFWQSMRSEMDRLFDRFSGFDLPSFGTLAGIEHFWPKPNGETLSLAVDVAEDDKSYTITADVPGIDEKDIDISVSEDVLTLKGEKHAEKEEKDKQHYFCERSYGVFKRSFALPSDVDTSKVDAKFAKGVLTITLPKNPKAAPSSRKIPVKGA